MKNILTLILIYIFTYNQVQGMIIPPSMDTHSIHLQCSELLRDDRTLRFKNHFFNSLVLVNDSVGYYNPVGTLHLFEIHFDTVPEVILLKDSPYNGHNFSRFLFTYNNNLYSLGGVGLFNTNSELLKYDFKKNEWFKVKIDQLPTNTSNVLTSWFDGNRLYTCYVLDRESSEFLYGYTNMDSLNFHDLNRINHLSSKDLHSGTQGVHIHEGEVFSVIEIHGIENNCFYRLFNHQTGELLKVSFLKDKPCITGKSFVYTRDSTIYYRFEDGSIDSTQVDETTIYFQKSFTELYLSSPENDMTSNPFIFLLVGLGLSIFPLLYFYQRKTKSNSSTSEESDGLNEIINELLTRKGERVLVKEMDAILRTTHFSVETAKSMRSKMIKSINNSGRISIKRVRNQDDGRYFDYLIE